ncbi:hypothetical protein Sjap_005964 [Stephania japonica]|uniref:Uncharacterized protein n=1 Tax=Stephania japonica TaxID=461633 RepID=A0AAP0K566_9MAGN
MPTHYDFDTRLHRVQLRGHPQENWVVYHRRYIELWENRGNTIAIIEQEGEHDGALREFLSTFERQLERVFIDDGIDQGIAALHEGIRILDEDERQRTTMWNDKNVVEPEIDDETSQEEEEEQ